MSEKQASAPWAFAWSIAQPSVRGTFAGLTAEVCRSTMRDRKCGKFSNMASTVASPFATSSRPDLETPVKDDYLHASRQPNLRY